MSKNSSKVLYEQLKYWLTAKGQKTRNGKRTKKFSKANHYKSKGA
tara:strand:+ start:687 stop:821 length:135 start_codon:yes stop_codon:yes gene_type:complete